MTDAASRSPFAQNRYVAFVLREDVRIVEVPEIDVDVLVIEGESFANTTRDHAPDYFTGFYDWIVENGAVCALRWIPFGPAALFEERCPHFEELCRRRSYVTEENGMYEIRLPVPLALRDLPPPPPNSAWDGINQLFGDNAVFRSESGGVVLTVRVSEAGGSFDRVLV